MARKAVTKTDKKEEAAKVTLDDIAAANAEQKRKEALRDERLQQELMYGQKAYKRNVHDTLAEKETRYARLHTFGIHNNVEMFWDFHPEAIQKQLFKIKVGKEEAVISATELQKYLRWV